MFFDNDNDESESEKDENTIGSDLSNGENNDDENNDILNFEEFHPKFKNKTKKKKL